MGKTNTLKLSDRTAVVTGGGRGIGAAVARSLASAGARVLVAARTAAQVDETSRKLRDAGLDVMSATVDVSDPDSVARLGAFAKERLGKVDILVNNAGIATSAPLKALELEEWNRILAINATGTYLCTRAFAIEMAERNWGRVVNVASVASRVGAPYISAYTASKHAVLGFTRAIAAELRDKGVTVNAVCPGYVDTDMTTESVARVKARTKLSDEQALEAILKTVGQRRLITPEEVAFLVTMLCAEEAGGVTGQAIVIDGGGLLA